MPELDGWRRENDGADEEKVRNALRMSEKKKLRFEKDICSWTLLGAGSYKWHAILNVDYFLFC